MKKCNKCGSGVAEHANFCTICGSADFSVITQSDEPVQNYQPIVTPVYQMQNSESISETDVGNGNILAGIVGAFLFSLIGGLLYFVVYQIGFIAGICGLVIFILANFGYGLFAKTKNKESLVGLIVSIVAMVVMIFLAEYFCISFEIYSLYREQGATFFEAVKVTPEFLAEPEVSAAFFKDLIIAYILGFIASIGNIVNIVKARKNNKTSNGT